LKAITIGSCVTKEQREFATIRKGNYIVG
jgi:hypothetical protein